MVHWLFYVLLDEKNIYLSQHFLNHSESFTQISGLRIWFPTSKFGHEMNLKGLLNLVLLD